MLLDGPLTELSMTLWEYMSKFLLTFTDPRIPRAAYSGSPDFFCIHSKVYASLRRTAGAERIRQRAEGRSRPTEVLKDHVQRRYDVDKHLPLCRTSLPRHSSPTLDTRLPSISPLRSTLCGVYSQTSIRTLFGETNYTVPRYHDS